MKFSKNLNIIAGDLKYVKDRIAAERLVTSISSIFGVDKNVLSKKIPEPVQQTQDYYPIDEPVHTVVFETEKEHM